MKDSLMGWDRGPDMLRKVGNGEMWELESERKVNVGMQMGMVCMCGGDEYRKGKEGTMTEAMSTIKGKRAGSILCSRVSTKGEQAQDRRGQEGTHVEARAGSEG